MGGIAPDSLAGTATGVFVGVSTNEYLQRALKLGDLSIVGPHAGTGNALSIAANRLSYVLGSRGPSMAVDTACSSSLVAVHLACQSLRSGESDLALAGGVNLLLSPETMINFSRARMLSPDGRCKTFDAAADGYVRGEGCGVVVLRRLSDARAAGDQVLAVVRGSAVNQDGRSNGLTAPNGPSQEAVVRRALEVAGVDPVDVGYVEAHGTGTPLGDPIELRALGRVLGPGRPPERPLVVGSVKTNIGHLEAAAGIAGLIKAVLAVHHGQIPAHLNFTEPNPHIPWDELPVVIPTALTPWTGRRVAGVSSFGFGGTNAHVVLEAPPAEAEGEGEATPPEEERAAPVVVKVAARGEPARAAAAARLARFVAVAPSVPLTEVAFAADVGRAELPDRGAVVASSPAELIEGLSALAEGTAARHVARGRAHPSGHPKLAFVVPGQGSRLAGAAQDLYGHEPVFTDTLDRLAEVLGPLTALPLCTLLDPEAGDTLTRTEHAQPALYALAIGLARWWQSVGIEPDLVLGHSVGAYAAAAVAGVFSDEDGARLVAARGRLMGALPPGGAMAAVFAPEAALAGILPPEIAVAAVNGPNEVVLSGPAGPLDAVLARLGAQGVTTRALGVSHAFHSALMDPVLDDLAAVLRATPLSVPRLEFVSDTTGGPAGPATATPGYWVEHARAPVRFAAALAHLSAAEVHTVIELGPATSTLGLARTALGEAAHYLPSLRPGTAPRRQLRLSAAEAWTEGHPLRWAALAPSPPRRRVHLPTYPFQRRRYWLPESTGARTPALTTGGLALRSIPTPLPQAIAQTEISLQLVPFLTEHRVHGHTVVPGVVFLELCLQAAALAGQPETTVGDLALLAPLLIDDDTTHTLQTVLTPDADGTVNAQLYSRHDDHPWQLHATAQLRPAVALPDPRDLATLRARCAEPVDVQAHYRELGRRGLDYGAQFQAVGSLWRGDGEALGRFHGGRTEGERLDDVEVRTVILDASLHVLAATLADQVGPEDIVVPTAVAQFTAVTGDAMAGSMWCHAALHPSSGAGWVEGDFTILDDGGAVVAAARRVRLHPMPADRLGRAPDGVGPLLPPVCTGLARHRPTRAPSQSLRDLSVVDCRRSGRGRCRAGRSPARAWPSSGGHPG